MSAADPSAAPMRPRRPSATDGGGWTMLHHRSVGLSVPVRTRMQMVSSGLGTVGGWAAACYLATMATPRFNMTAHLHRQIDWARQTFGPGPRTAALLDHIRKELAEIAESPSDTREWLDVVILALEGAMRTGVSPANLCATLTAMQERNEARKWADWRTAPPGVASEHDRTATADAFSRHLDTASAVVATWPTWKQHVLGGFIDCPAEEERTAECKRVNVTPIYGWSRGRFPSDDLPRELAAAGVKEWDYHSMCPDDVMVYVDSEADGAVVARAVWRGILLSQKTSGNSFHAYDDDGGGRHVVRFSRIPATEDRSKPPPGYRLIHGCDGFSFADHEGGHHAAAMHNLGHGWRQDAALVNAWAHHDARKKGSTR